VSAVTSSPPGRSPAALHRRARSSSGRVTGRRDHHHVPLGSTSTVTSRSTSTGSICRVASWPPYIAARHRPDRPERQRQARPGRGHP
jgi:hypothetical protein